MADQPYIKWWTSDFLTGVIDLSAEEIGVYAILLTMMADRGGPVPCADPSDRQWLARRCNTTTRAFGRALERLIALGKIEQRAGLLGNRRMMQEIKERDRKTEQTREAARARWAKWESDHPLSLFDPPDQKQAKKLPKKREKNSQKNSQKNSRKNSQKNPLKQRNSAIRAEKTHQIPSRARAVRARAPESESEIHIPTHPTREPCKRAPDQSGRVGSGDDQSDQVGGDRLAALYRKVVRASGFRPAGQDQIDRAMGFIRAWDALGLDHDKVLIPLISAATLKADEPTRTLGRFDAAVRLAAAKQLAAPPGKPATPPEPPLIEPDGEDPQFHPVRIALLARLGPVAFARLCNRVRFEAVETATGKQALRVRDDGTGAATRLKDALGQTVLRNIAKDHGFDDVW